MNTVLDEDLRYLLDESEERRIEACKTKRIFSYQSFDRILERSEILLKSKPGHNMPNLLVVAEAGNGKSTIAQYMANKHSANKQESEGYNMMPVMLLQANAHASDEELFTLILQRLSPDGQVLVRRRTQQLFRLLHLLPRVGTRLIFIDEIQTLLKGPGRQPERFIDSLKLLMNELGIPVVGLGTRDAEYILDKDEQMRSRFSLAELPRWRNSEELQELLNGFESVLPLHNESGLAQPKTLEKILELTNGIMRGISQLVRFAAIHAIQTGSEQVTSTELQAVVDDGDWRPAK